MRPLHVGYSNVPCSREGEREGGREGGTDFLLIILPCFISYFESLRKNRQQLTVGID